MVALRGIPAAATGERYQLIVIVALCEAFIGLGLGSIEIPLSTMLVVVSVLGIVTIAALRWAYFEVLVPAGERARQGSAGRPGRCRPAMRTACRTRRSWPASSCSP